jgi:hypothetical protein
MWTDSRALLKTKYDSVVGTGTGYTAFKAKVTTALPGATDPIVIVDGPPPLPQANSATSNIVQVQVFWQLPGDPILHNYTTTGVIGQQN